MVHPKNEDIEKFRHITKVSGNQQSSKYIIKIYTQDWNSMKLSKFSLNFHFWVNYAFNKNPNLFLDPSFRKAVLSRLFRFSVTSACLEV